MLSGHGIDKSQSEVSSIETKKKGTFDKYYKPYVGRDAVVASVSFVRPKTSPDGSVRLASKSFRDKPKIDPQYLRNPYDVERLIDGKSFYYIIES